MTDSKELKSELNSILTRERIIGSLNFQDERQSLIASIRALKEKYGIDKLPVSKKQRGLTAFIREVDKFTTSPDYSQVDDDRFKTSISTYLDASEGAGGKVEEKVEEEVLTPSKVKSEVDIIEERVKRAEERGEVLDVDAEEEKEEVNEKVKEKVEKGDSIKEAEAKRKEAEKRLESTIDEIGVMGGEKMTDDADEMKKSQKEIESSIEELLSTPSPRNGAPTQPQQEPQAEEKSIEDISTEQVVEIPSERKGTDGKSMKQLDGDIKFFLSKYPSLLKQEAAFYKKMKKTKRNLVELHRRIEAKLAPVEKKPQTIGVIVDADKYIDERIKALLVEKTMEGLKPADLVVDVSEPEDKSLMRKGSYVLSKGRAGRLAIERAPVYRNIPTTNPQPRPRPYQDVSMLKSQRWDLTNTAKKHVLSDPFIEKQPVKRINLLL